MEKEREEEKVLVPVLRKEIRLQEEELKELTKEDCETKIWQAPPRWRVR